MNRRPALLTLLLLLLVARLVASPPVSRDQLIAWIRAVRGVSIGLPTAPSLCYELPETGGLRFPLDRGILAIRVLTNGSIDAAASPTAPLHYALRWELLKGHLAIKSGVYHHNTALSLVPDNAEKTLTPAYAFKEPGQRPLEGRTLPLGSVDPEATHLRLSVEAKDPALAAVIARVYLLSENPERKWEYLWNRLTRGQMVSLARGNIYPYDLLTDFEKEALMRHTWHPVGPTGIEGRDYTLRKLYMLQDPGEFPRTEPVPPEGLLLTQAMRVTLPLPEEGARFRVAATPLVPSQSGAMAPLALTWYGRGPGKRHAQSLAMDDRGQSPWISLPGGLVELASEQPATLQFLFASGEKSGGEESVPPQPATLRGYLLDDGNAITWTLFASGQPTPFRADLRPLGGPGTGPSAVRYTLLDRQGKAIGTGEVDVDTPPSLYDRLLETEGAVPAGDARRLFFLLPTETSKIRFTAPAPVLMTAHTRPYALAGTARIPEDLFLAGDPDLQSAPTWFPLRPDGYDGLLSSNRSRLLILQTPPPKENEEIAQGRFLWEAFTPAGAWTGQYLLTPEEPAETLREEAYGATFTPLLPGTTRLRFQAPADRPTLAPQLAFTGADPDTGTPVSLRIDGAPYTATTLFTDHGLLPLPPLTPGEHRLTLSAPNGPRFFMSHIDGPPPCCRIRFAVHTTPGGLSYDYDKRSPGEERITLLFFPEHQNRGVAPRTRIRVRLTHAPRLSHGPWEQLTLTEKVYDLRTPTTPPLPILNQTGRFTEGGERFTFSLGSDLPPGRHRLQVFVEKGNQGYLQLFRVTPGRHDKRIIIREASHDMD